MHKCLILLRKLVILTGIPSKEAKAEIEIHPVIVEANVNEGNVECVQYNLDLYKPFSTFYSSIYFALFLKGNNFLFDLDFSI